ncbi:Uncharacterised protein [Shigella flexneri]|nr:Uncharacterised protein [Shigella flexneri]
MAANKISLGNEISGTNRLFAHAKVRNRQAARFFGVVNKIALCVPRRGITDNLDIVFGCGNAAITTKAIKQGFKFRRVWQSVFRQRQ